MTPLNLCNGWGYFVPASRSEERCVLEPKYVNDESPYGRSPAGRRRGRWAKESQPLRGRPFFGPFLHHSSSTCFAQARRRRHSSNWPQIWASHCKDFGGSLRWPYWFTEWSSSLSSAISSIADSSSCVS